MCGETCSVAAVARVDSPRSTSRVTSAWRPGRTLVLDGVNVFRIADGEIVERWGRVDDLGLLRELGLVPPGPHRTP